MLELVFRVLFVLFGLASCGRWGFDAQPNDSHGSEPPAPIDADACGGGTTAPDPLTVSGQTIQVTNFSGGTTPSPSVDVEVHAVADDSLLGAVTSDASDGTYSIAIATAGVPLLVYIKYSKVGLLDVYEYPAVALDRDYAYDPNVFSSGSLGAVYSAAGVSQVGGTGTIDVQTFDCAGGPLDGVVVDFSPEPGHIGYTGAGSDPYPPDAGTTWPPYTHADGFSEPPGDVTIAATLPGTELARQSPVKVYAGAVTFATVHPVR